MTTSIAPAAAHHKTPKDLRVWDRFSCDVPVSCQPPFGFGGGDLKWSAQICDVSPGGLCLILQRRFERGATLAIELPTQGGSTPSTLLARVANVKAAPGGMWSLGCAFVSQLGDEELHILRSYARADDVALPEAVCPSAVKEGLEHAETTCIRNVLARVKLPDGRRASWTIQRVAVNVAWPLRAGSTVRLRIHFPWGYSPPTPMAVRKCRLVEGQWILDCSMIGPPPVDFFRPHDKGD
jgi:PilZ domain